MNRQLRLLATFVMFFGTILTALGLIGLIIGIFFTLPLIIGAVVWAYENLCNPPPRTGAGS